MLAAPAHLKVILGTGDLLTLRNVAKASMVAMMAGADFIKTSTGKEAVNAILPVGVVMTRAIREYAEENWNGGRFQACRRDSDSQAISGMARADERRVGKQLAGRASFPVWSQRHARGYRAATGISCEWAVFGGVIGIRLRNLIII